MRLLIPSTLIMIALVAIGHAAPITWEATSTPITSPSDVINDGIPAPDITYIKDTWPSGTSSHLAAGGAVDFGPGGTVNGVVFTGAGGSDDYWTAEGGTSTGDATLDAIIGRHAAFGSTGDPWVLTLGGLTPNTAYKIQIIGIHDLRTAGGINSRTTTYQDQDGGSASPTLTRGTGGSVIGTFTTGPAETSMNIDGIGASDPGAGAVVLRVIPTGQPLIGNAAVDSITASGANASATLEDVDADVTLFWATTDYGTNLTDWQTNGSSDGPSPEVVGPVNRTITGLAIDTAYTCRFHAVNTAPDPDLEDWSSPATFATPLTGKAVTDLFADPFSPFEIDLDWTDNFNTETGFIVQRSPSGAGTWTTVATLPANTEFHTDVYTGVVPGTTYDYRVLATNAQGDSDPSNVATATADPASPLATQVLVNFDGTLVGTTYTLDPGETDTTGTFQGSGAPAVSGGLATINPGNAGGIDGFHFNPGPLGDLTLQNWVAEALIYFEAFGGGQLTAIDVQGDTSLRINNAGTGLQAVYWNGSSNGVQDTGLPPAEVRVHVAMAWDASTGTLTGYVNGSSIGPISQGAFATPDLTNVSFGYFGRADFDGRGIDGVLDAVAFQSGAAAFDPGSDFLILPAGTGYAGWIAGFPGVGALNGLDDDPDGDQLSNGIEAFFGTDPSQRNAGIGQLSTDGTITSFSHPQAEPALNDIAGSYQWSLDLENWYAGDGTDGPLGGPTVSIPGVTPTGGTADVTATASEALSRFFLRIQAAP
ncbi:hypothetical protein [Haloferula sp. A504]|uniref:hypothetical protein n=1 Tax=Haloferula sp. A504 TaxID=3373601 RepID=UPI0031BEA3EF|nr:hypothetical protein [Verrucomicrobiaceae bacterium E54]